MCVAEARGLHDTEDAWYGIGKRLPKLFWHFFALIVRKALVNQEDDAFGTVHTGLILYHPLLMLEGKCSLNVLVIL